MGPQADHEEVENETSKIPSGSWLQSKSRAFFCFDALQSGSMGLWENDTLSNFVTGQPEDKRLLGARY